jgi:Transglutaminase-like superfamily
MPEHNSKTRFMKQRLAPAVLTLLALQGLASLSPVPLFGLRAQAEANPADLWYIIKMAGQSAGYIHEVTRPEGQGLSTDSEMLIVLNRLGSQVKIGFLSVSEETQNGLLRRVRYEMTASDQTTKSEAVIKEGKVEIRNDSGGKTYTNTLKYEGDIYGPEGVRRLTAAGLRKPGDKVTIQTFVAEASLVGKITRTVLSREPLKLGSQEMPALKVEEVLEGMPTKRTGWLDEQGNLLRQDEPGPFGMIEVWRSEKPAALAAASGGELPQEVYQNSIVRTNVRLPRALPIDYLKLRIIHRHPELGWPHFEIGGQKVLAKTEKEVILEIRRPQAPPGSALPVAKTESNRQYLDPNAFIQSDDAEILHLAKELVGSETDALEAALRLERWVSENMNFDLGIVFAPATEIIRNRRGTCVGYATLLASLARAAGLPSRIVMGYVYALGMFGGHAWAEVMIGEKWVPFDAAVVNAGVADATRVSLVASSLAEGMGEIALGAAQQVFGQVGIEILEYQTGGKSCPVPEAAKPYSITGDWYDNRWLGIRLPKPASFRFGNSDAVWPDPTVVEMDGPGDEKVFLEQQGLYPWEEPEKAVWEKLEKIISEGKKSQLNINKGSALILDAEDGQRSAAAIIRGLEVWIIRAEGKDARLVLRQVAKSVRISG